MDELIGQLASKTGIDNVVAEKTVGIMLGFLRSEGPSDKVQALIDKIPGAEAAIAAASPGGTLGKLMGNGIMAVGTRLMALGLGLAENRAIARELFKFSETKSEQTKWARSSRGHRGLVNSHDALLDR